MTHEEHFIFIKRYIRQTAIAILNFSARIKTPQEFLVSKHMELTTDIINECNDPYSGHLIKLYRVGYSKQIPLEIILEECERYRLSLINVFESNSEIEKTFLSSSDLYKTGKEIQLKCLTRYCGKLGIQKILHDYIKTQYPLLDFADGTALFNSNLNNNHDPINIVDRKMEYPEEMTAEEAAEYLDTTVNNLYNLTSSREIPHFKRGRKLVFKYSELKEWKLKKVSSKDELNTIAANHLLLKKKKQ